MIAPLGAAPLVVVVGAGGVGKTTLAAALGILSARAGERTLVMTFDPSERLRDALGVAREARERPVAVPLSGAAPLEASLLDPRRTFDALVERWSPDAASARRVLDNPFYRRLAGGLGGVLEYMAVERLYEVWSERCYARIVLDTPPTRQALDFLGAPERIVTFLDSGAVRLALRPWFDEAGRLRTAKRVPFLGRGVESFLDRTVGLDLLRDMAEFFAAFAPLYAGFRDRAAAVRDLLRSNDTRFALVTDANEERLPDAMYFARKLDETGHRLGAVIVNRVHPAAAPAERADEDPRVAEARRLAAWLGERDRRGAERLRSLLPGHDVVEVPLLPRAPSGLDGLEALGRVLAAAAER